MSTASMIITIAPGLDGKPAMSVSFCGADGAPTGPPRDVVLNNRLAGFVADMQEFARVKLATLEAAPQGRAPDRDEAIAVEVAESKQIG